MYVLCRAPKEGLAPEEVESDGADGGIKDGLEQNVHRVLRPDGAGAKLHFGANVVRVP